MHNFKILGFVGNLTLVLPAGSLVSVPTKLSRLMFLYYCLDICDIRPSFTVPVLFPGHHVTTGQYLSFPCYNTLLFRLVR